MQAPTGDVLDAIKRVAGRPEGAIILGFLQQQLDAMNLRLAHEHDAVILRQLQGEVCVLYALVQVWKP